MNIVGNDIALFNPAIQEIFEDIIILIKSDQKDEAIEKVMGLIDLSGENYKALVETKKHKKDKKSKWVPTDVPLGIQWFRTTIDIIKQSIYPYNHWLKIVLSQWVGNSYKEGSISRQTFDKVMNAIGGQRVS